MDKQLIYEKVAKVMAEIEPIAKERKNTQQGYNFRGIDDLMNALSPLVTKHGIFPTTAKVEDLISENVTSKQGAQGWRTVRRYTFRFYAEDGSFVETITDGEASDYGDKGSNKAYSVAYREAMFKMLVIPFQTEDIEEAGHEITATARTATASTPTATSAKPLPPRNVEQARLAKKKCIMDLCGFLSQAPLLTGLDYSRYVSEKTGLTLEPEHFDDIITRLESLKS